MSPKELKRKSLKTKNRIKSRKFKKTNPLPSQLLLVELTRALTAVEAHEAEEVLAVPKTVSKKYLNTPKMKNATK